MRKIIVLVLLLSLSVLALYSAVYLHGLDKTTVKTSVHNVTITTTYTRNIVFCMPAWNYNCTRVCLLPPTTLTGTTVMHETETTTIPPPSYASLWPYMLTLGIIILGLAMLIFRHK
ncbi:hypothetical protein [Acidianus ambivalens]|uniref:hypothetical protein n=1 Tax=Acidianus ambivalens TaxID=2283 RepID=UPI00128EB0A7|nr:hypothetical protein [Acidianus ambivalens]